MRRYPFKHMLNVRDLGGYPLSHSLERETKFGVFVRADVPVKIEDEEAAFLLERNISTVIDLRSVGELEEKPCAFASIRGFEYCFAPFWLGETLPKDAESVSALYFDMVDEKRSVAGVFKILANAPGGALFHCTAGKDRTGIIAALLLSACGVSKLDIIADYQVTYTYIQEMIRKLAAAYPDMSAWMGRSNPEFMEGFFRLFEAKYGSARDYLLKAGVTMEELNAVTAKLTGV